jgi:drug/metabolite transporter (DMT)-like permease
MPAVSEVRSTALLGLTMFGINYACLFWAEQRVASGYAAIISSTIPVWVFAGEWLWLQTVRPRGAAVVGILLGISGVALLVLPGGQGEWTFASLALLTGTLCWAGGTLWSRRAPMPRSRLVSAGLQMAFGGTFLFLLSFATGEFARRSFFPHWTLRLTFDMAYLIIAASVVAFLAFVWLIDHEPASRVSSYAYVNPLIAVVLGAVVAGERLAAIQFAGAALVLTGVVTTLRAKRS